MKMLSIAVPLVTALARGRTAVASSSVLTDADKLSATPRDAAEPDWQSAYRRRRDEDGRPDDREAPPPLLGLLPAAAPVPRESLPAVAEVRTASSTPTTERIEVVRQLADANAATTPVARSWQIELPNTGAAWQLHIEQAQPLAPLNLELRVPPVAQSQARQQLGDLDKRLRAAGHDVLRPLVRGAHDTRGGRRSQPVDEAEPS